MKKQASERCARAWSNNAENAKRKATKGNQREQQKETPWQVRQEEGASVIVLLAWCSWIEREKRRGEERGQEGTIEERVGRTRPGKKRTEGAAAEVKRRRRTGKREVGRGKVEQVEVGRS